jgi:hypothetical protein
MQSTYLEGAIGIFTQFCKRLFSDQRCLVDGVREYNGEVEASEEVDLIVNIFKSLKRGFSLLCWLISQCSPLKAQNLFHSMCAIACEIRNDSWLYRR